MVEGVGGGTCQVSSTFHAATLFAGFDVLERLPHSRPSAYIPMGLDSTVVYPAVDLEGPQSASVPGRRPREVLGQHASRGDPRQDASGACRLQSRGGVDAPVQAQDRGGPDALGQEVLVKQHGIQGYKIKRTRLFTYPDGTKKKEEETDTYPPTTEIYKVPVGFDVAALPPLPGGEGEDSELGGNPSPTPPSARAPSSAGTDATAAVAADPDPGQRCGVRRCTGGARALRVSARPSEEDLAEALTRSASDPPRARGFVPATRSGARPRDVGALRRTVGFPTARSGWRPNDPQWWAFGPRRI